MPIDCVDLHFIYREPGLPQEPLLCTSAQKAHAHSHSATSINREDIEEAKRDRTTNSVTIIERDGQTESCSTSASVSTAMHQMVDGLIASETSENFNLIQHFPQISHGESPLTPTLDDPRTSARTFDHSSQHTKLSTAHDLARRMQQPLHSSVPAVAPPMEREETLRPPLPSIMNSPFAPLPGEAGSSPQSRPSTATRVPHDGSASQPQTSSGLFQQDLLRKQQLQLQSTLNDLSVSSWSCSQPPPEPSKLPERSQTLLSLWAESLSPSLHDVKQNLTPISRFGPIGQIPPSG